MPANSNDVLVRFMADTSNLMQGISRADGALAKMSNGMAQSLNGLSNKVKAVGLVIGTTFAVAITNSTSQAIQFEALMDNISKTMGDSANDFVKWQDTVGKSLGFSKMESAKLAVSLGTNMRQISKDQEDYFQKTTALMKASAIIRANTGLSQTEVSDRIRSAMNQEADGADELGINVRTSAIQMSEAYKTMANGQPWSELTSNMQKAILYQYILDTTTRNYGNELANNTSVQLAIFKASLQDMSLALGQAFQPIVAKVLPYLSALVSWITKALGYVRIFMETLFGYKHTASKSQAQTNAIKSTTGATKDLGKAIGNTTKARKADADAMKKQKKEAEGFLASFDEVHTIAKKSDTSSPSSGSGGAGGGGGGVSGGGGGVGGGLAGMLPGDGGLATKLDAVGKKVQEFAEKVKKFFKPIGELFVKIGGIVKDYLMEKVRGLGDWWAKNGEQIMQAMSNVWKVLKPIFEWIVKFIWENLKLAIDGLIQLFEGVVEFFTGIFTGDMSMVWQGIKDIFIGAIKALWGIINLMFVGDIVALFRGGIVAITKVFKEIGPTLGKLWTNMWTFMKGECITAWNAIKTTFSTKASELVTKLQGISPNLWDALVGVFKNVGKWFADNVVTPIKDKFTSVHYWINYYIQKAWTAVKTPFSSASKWFLDNVKTPIANRFSDLKNSIGNYATTAWNNLKKPFLSAYSWFKTNVANKINSAFTNIFKGFKDGGIVGGIKAIMNTAIGYLNGFIKLFNKIKNKIPFVKGISDIPSIPKLYRGGITNGKTIAQIGDNVGGREVVSPLNQLQGIIANTMMSALSMRGGNSGGGQGGPIVLNIDGREFARITQPYTNMEQRRVGTNVRLNRI